MKSIHFCTKNKLIEIGESQPDNELITYRTGFIPHLYPGDVVKINERKNRIFEKSEDQDRLLRYGEIEDVEPYEYWEIEENNEIDDVYDKDFHPRHYFFRIKIRILDDGDVNEVD